MATEPTTRRTAAARSVRAALIIGIGLLLATTFGSAASASTAPSAAPSTVPPTGIRAVDLSNDVVYRMGQVAIEPTDGTAHFRSPWRDTDSVFTIKGHLYGDVTGDGQDDAAVWASYTDEIHGGGTRDLDGVWVVHLDGETTHVAGPTWTGNGAHGGLEYAEIRDGYLATSTFNGRDVCCPSSVTETRWIARGDGLIPTESFPPRAYVDLSKRGAADVADVDLMAGTTTAVVESHPSRGADSFTFEADARQSIRLRHRWGAADIRISRLDTGKVIGTLTHNQSVNVPVDGRYLAQVQPSPEALGQASLEFTVATNRTLHSPTWVPRAFFDDSVGDIGVHWPELVDANPGVDLDRANRLIRDVVDAEISNFRHETRRQHHAENEHSGLWIDYKLTLVAYDLVSLDLFVNRRVSGAEGDAERSFDRRSLVIDLNQHRLIAIDQLVGLLDERKLVDAWWDGLATSQPWLLHNDYMTKPDTSVDWLGAIVRPTGMALTADAPHGGLVEAVVTWEQLGDLATTAGADATPRFERLAYRARASRTLPISMDQCGC